MRLSPGEGGGNSKEYGSHSIRVGGRPSQNHLQRGVHHHRWPRFDERGAAVRLSRDPVGTPQRRRVRFIRLVRAFRSGNMPQASCTAPARSRKSVVKRCCPSTAALLLFLAIAVCDHAAEEILRIKSPFILSRMEVEQGVDQSAPRTLGRWYSGIINDFSSRSQKQVVTLFFDTSLLVLVPPMTARESSDRFMKPRIIPARENNREAISFSPSLFFSKERLFRRNRALKIICYTDSVS